MDTLVNARAQGQPVAYLVGEREFYSLSLSISPDVLIPRPETELLVDRALAFIRAKPDARVLDLGTGSGAIALAIASNAPAARVLATDISRPSLDLARDNAARHALGNLSFQLSDWFDQLDKQTFDLIVSNPPYIDPADPHLGQGDVRFEPRHALVASDHGLADIRRIVTGAFHHLRPGGLLAIEHGYDQGKTVRALMTGTGLSDALTQQDLNRLDRVTSAGQARLSRRHSHG